MAFSSYLPRLTLLLVSAVATGCSAELAAVQHIEAATDSGFTAPPGWDFPAGSVLPVQGTGGAVASTDPVATEIGIEILRRGGNAIDAAIATHFALAVVNPEAGNIGGGGFIVLRLADGTAAALDFRETAPLAATREMFLDTSGEVAISSTQGHLSSGVPGSVAGMWEAHQRFGSLPWEDLLQPAINLAEGIVVHDRLAGSLRSYATRLARNPAAAAVFLPGGNPPRVGDRLVQSDLAETLRRIATDGAAGFYHGTTAALIEAEMQRGGGLINREDLARYRAIWRDPIAFDYRGHTVLSMPPASSGGATIAELLNILEGYDLRSIGHHSPDHIHLFVEAAKRAFADRNSYLGDSDYVEMPIEAMISPEYAARRGAEIERNRATPSVDVQPDLGPVAGDLVPISEPVHTTHFSVLDRNGNAVAVTTTINSLYGNAIMVEGAGFLLNNEMDDFAVRPGHPNQFGLVQGEANAIAPGKRMLSAMTPTIVLAPEGHVRLITGSPGGPTIITTVAQVISNIIDFDMNAADATLAPRIHHQHLPDVIRYEREGLLPSVVDDLRRRGHAVEERSDHSGDVQTILVLPDGTITAAADPRRGGKALVLNR